MAQNEQYKTKRAVWHKMNSNTQFEQYITIRTVYHNMNTMTHLDSMTTNEQFL